MTESLSGDAFTAIVLAGERGAGDPLRNYSGVACKALIKIQGVPMIHRVLAALGDSQRVNYTWISGPHQPAVQSDQELSDLVASGKIGWRSPESTPSTSAYELMCTIGAKNRFLLTTADHPLLSAEIVDTFCRGSVATDADVAVGLAPYHLVRERFPDMKKTVLRFSDGEYCGCNLFAFLTPEGRSAADFWRKIENERKKPLLLIGLLGWRSVIRYRLGLLSLDEALQRLSKMLGLRLKAVILPYANAAVDVDTIADYQVVESSLAALRET